jgi:uncharacterized alpha-E superfamily protein
MLGKTAGGLYWLFRYMERSENLARLISAGQRIALTRSSTAPDEWDSIVATAGVRDAYLKKYDTFEGDLVIDFILRDPDNASSVLSVIEGARNNARTVRTALTREVWEAVNECWMVLCDALARKVPDRDLPFVLSTIRQRSAFVRGAMHGTMVRADSTARILDVKYYVLLPSAHHVGTSIDNVQWETILRSVSADGSFRYLHGYETKPLQIAEFLTLDRRLPRSLAFCYTKICANLGYLETDYGLHLPCHDTSDEIHQRFRDASIDMIFEKGLHEFLQTFIHDNNALGQQIEADYRFTG